MALSLRSRSFYGMSFDPSQVGTAPPMLDGQVNAAPSGIVSDLSTYKSRGVRVILKMVNPNQCRDANSHFSMTMWKDRVDDCAAAIGAQQMGNFVLDGTALGHNLMDDAKAGSAIFNGVPPTADEMDEMARYSKSKWSLLPTMVRVDNIYLAGVKSDWTNLDYAWCQWHERFGNAQTWITNNVRDGRTVGLGTLVGFNLLNGGSGLTAPWDASPDNPNDFGMSPQEIDAITNVASQQTFVIGCVGWSARPNFDETGYYDLPSIQTALQRLADAMSTRTMGPWNWREHSPSGSTDTTPGGGVVIGGWSVKDDGAGTVARANNSNSMQVTPPNTYGEGDLHLMLVCVRDSALSLLPLSGWNTANTVSGNSAQGGQLTLLHKIGTGETEQAVTLQFKHDAPHLGTSHLARWFVLSHNSTILANLVDAGSAGSWGHKTGMGPVPGMTSTRSDALVLICAARVDDFGNGNVDENVMSATTGDEQWTRLFSTGCVSGNDVGFFVDYAPTSGIASIDTKSWTQTTGSSAGSGVGFMVAFAPLSVVSGTPPAFITDFGDEPIVMSLGSHLSFTLSSTGSTPITYSKTSGPSNITLGSSSGAFEWTPSASGNYVIGLQASNDFGTDDQTFVVLIAAAAGTNTAPSITHPGNMTVKAQQLLAFGVSVTDADGDTLTYTIENGPAGAHMDSGTGQFVWVPSGDQGPGTYPVTLAVTDGVVTSRSTFTITVTDAEWTRLRGPRSFLGSVNPGTNQFRRI